MPSLSNRFDNIRQGYNNFFENGKMAVLVPELFRAHDRQLMEFHVSVRCQSDDDLVKYYHIEKQNGILSHMSEGLDLRSG